MVEYDRVKAQCRADVNQNLLRGIQMDRARLTSRLRLLQGEIEGAQKVIDQKQQQIETARRQLQELQKKLDTLNGQASELTSDQARWLEQRAV